MFEEDLQEFYDMVDTGRYTYKELASWFGINVSTVQKYLRKRTCTQEEYEERKAYLLAKRMRAAPASYRRYTKLLNLLERYQRNAK